MLQIICALFLIDIIFGDNTNCPGKFEKIIALRPFSSSSLNLLYQNDKNLPITTECLQECLSNENCQSFIIFYNNASCYWLEKNADDFQDNVPDTNTNWFNKICIGEDCGKLWVFDRVPGATLIDNDSKKIGNITRLECQQFCLDQTDFECRSAKFRLKNGLGTCVLSTSDRFLSNSYRVSTYSDEYLENECSNDLSGDNQNFCAYDKYSNAILAHRDLFYHNRTVEECQELCDSLKQFNCRSFSVVYEKTYKSYMCFLQSEDTKILGPQLLIPHSQGMYLEKVRCINISVVCSQASMSVIYTSRSKFFGRIYIQGYYETPGCYNEGYGNNSVKLRLQLIENQCGILKANGLNNRTLWTGNLILQYNPLIQTHSDRIIRIGCIFGNSTRILVGTGVTISNNLPNTGSVLINSANFSTSNPNVEMRVLDVRNHKEVTDSEVGQDLQLVIQAPINESYDIMAGHLVAMTEKNDESILLLDERGCPTNTNIFPKFAKVASNSSLELQALFQAFKFASSPIVRFSVIVQFCPSQCPKVICGNETLSRKRKASDIETKGTIREVKNFKELPLEFVMLVRNPNIYSDQLVADHKVSIVRYDYKENEICLEYSLFIGLTIIWVLIPVIIALVSVLIIRRYRMFYEQEYVRQSIDEIRKNFDFGFSSNFENRRVHFADNEEHS